MTETIQLPTTLANIAEAFGAFAKANAKNKVLVALLESLDQASQLNQKSWLKVIDLPDVLQPAIDVVVNDLRAALDWRAHHMPGLPNHECLPSDYIEAGKVLEDWARQTMVANRNS